MAQLETSTQVIYKLALNEEEFKALKDLTDLDRDYSLTEEQKRHIDKLHALIKHVR